MLLLQSNIYERKKKYNNLETVFMMAIIVTIWPQKIMTTEGKS